MGSRTSTPFLRSVTVSLWRCPCSGSGPLSRNRPICAADPKSIGVRGPVVGAVSAGDGPTSSFLGGTMVYSTSSEMSVRRYVCPANVRTSAVIDCAAAGAAVAVTSASPMAIFNAFPIIRAASLSNRLKDLQNPQERRRRRDEHERRHQEDDGRDQHQERSELRLRLRPMAALDARRFRLDAQRLAERRAEPVALDERPDDRSDLFAYG